jgi:DNA-binding NtrC family response regulator
MPTLLVIDDDPLILKCIDLALAGGAITFRPAATAAAAVAEFSARRPDAVLTDVRLPDKSGLDLLAELRRLDPKVPVVLMTGHGTAETAIEAMRRGAFDYLLKPLDPDQLTELVERAFEVSRLMRVPARVPDAQPDPAADGDLFVGNAPAMQEVFKTIGRVAPTPATVLIRGESGTGKEMVARAVYHYSNRSDKPFLAINCSAIPEHLLESELFGHEKGAFTGADRKRIGKFEQCHGGTLFLNEIGDMTPLTQAKVLRVLQEQQFERVGGSEQVRTDVRLVAATHRDLEGMIAAGTFREDLFYRLNVCTVRLPALRERPEDIPLLVDHFLRRYRDEFGKDVRSVDAAAADALRAFPWPGNVRQLQSVVKQALLASAGPTLTVADLPPEVRPGGSAAALPTPGGGGGRRVGVRPPPTRGGQCELARRGGRTGGAGVADRGAHPHTREHHSCGPDSGHHPPHPTVQTGPPGVGGGDQVHHRRVHRLRPCRPLRNTSMSGLHSPTDSFRGG